MKITDARAYAREREIYCAQIAGETTALSVDAHIVEWAIR